MSSGEIWLLYATGLLRYQIFQENENKFFRQYSCNLTLMALKGKPKVSLKILNASWFDFGAMIVKIHLLFLSCLWVWPSKHFFVLYIYFLTSFMPKSPEYFTAKHFWTKYSTLNYCVLVGASFGFSHLSKKMLHKQSSLTLNGNTDLIGEKKC